MKASKKYTCIVKVDKDKFVKYRLSNLLKFVEFLNHQFPEWRWFNVYDKKTKEQLANYTKNTLPTSRHI